MLSAIKDWSQENACDAPPDPTPWVVSNILYTSLTEKGKKADRCSEQNSVQGHTALCRLGEELRRLAVERQAADSTRRNVQVRVACGPGAGDDTRIDDRREHLDTCRLDGNDPRRRVGIT